MLGIGINLCQPTLGATASSDPWDYVPQTGLLAQYKFDEGSGTTAADSSGNGKNINLAAPTTPNYTWVTTGLKLALGLVQTPSLTSCRTVVMLYRVGRGETSNFLLSGGSSSGDGWLGDSSGSGKSTWVGSARGVAPALQSTAFDNIKHLNRGWWQLGVFEYAAGNTSIFGLGGRHSTTNFRCPDFEIATAWFYNLQLSAGDRNNLYTAARLIAKQRGIYIDWRDCPTSSDVALIMGESNPDGRALISQLSAGDQARDVSKTYICAHNGTTSKYPPAALALGTNQQATSPATQFGPEIGLAWARQTSGLTRDLWVAKCGKGSTYLAPTSLGVAATSCWNVDALSNAGVLCFPTLLTLWDLEHYMLSQGIGPHLRYGMFWIGLNDQVNTSYVPSAATYQTWLQNVADFYETYTGGPGIKWHIPLVHDKDPTLNATAHSYALAAQIAFVAANPGFMSRDVSGYTMSDSVHLNGLATTGMPKFGQDAHSDIPW